MVLSEHTRAGRVEIEPLLRPLTPDVVQCTTHPSGPWNDQTRFLHAEPKTPRCCLENLVAVEVQDSHHPLLLLEHFFCRSRPSATNAAGSRGASPTPRVRHDDDGAAVVQEAVDGRGIDKPSVTLGAVQLSQ